MNAQLPIQRATLEEIERNRQRAIDLYAEAYNKLWEARQFASLASGSRSHEIALTDEIRDALIGRHAFNGTNDDRRADFLEKVAIQTDRAIWDHVIQATDLERLMDQTAREDMRKQLAGTPPPATADNIRSTLLGMVEEADTIFKRGIATAFSKLDRAFKSHDGFKIGRRIVLERAFSSDYSGWNYASRKDEILRDVERTFYVLDGKQQPERAAGIVGLLSGIHLMKFEVENDYFLVKRFQNGNAHVWFTRHDLVRRVNRLLADYYGEALGEGADVASEKEMGPGYLTTPAKNFGFFKTPEAVVNKVYERLGHLDGTERVLEPSAGKGCLANRARAAGCEVICVDIQQSMVADLRAQGFETHQADFLTLLPGDIGMYDIVVMNPPFDQGRDCDHVRHALQFLKPGGRLVSVMAAGVEYRTTKRATSLVDIINKMQPLDRSWDPSRFQDLPPLSFKESGTNVNTLTVAVRKPV